MEVCAPVHLSKWASASGTWEKITHVTGFTAKIFISNGLAQ